MRAEGKPNMGDLTRRKFLRAAAACSVGAAAVLAGRPGDTAAAESDLITDETQNAIDRGLALLSSLQSPDGSYSDSRLRNPNVAITGLAGLALMAGGHQPWRGKYGTNVARASEYVMSRGDHSSPEGYLQNNDGQMAHGSMYQHGFGTLFLSEVYGMLPDPARQKRLRHMLEKAVSVIVNAQNSEGGWRYDPRPTQADVSVTVAQLMALRAARNAGIVVNKSIVDKCVDYIKGCRQRDGGFSYMKGHGANGSHFPRSAAAVVGLYSAGIYEGPEIEGGLKYLMRQLPGKRGVGVEFPNEHYFYGHYYAALAMWTAGGNYWAEWFPAIRDELVEKVRHGGNWIDYHGSAYATAMACIILQLPNNYLPIMQK